MQESELPYGWVSAKFEEFIQNLDGKRIPLRSSDRKNRQGQYPYYGASGIIDYIDDYIFDGKFLLISEDGANLVARNTPIAFIAKGKFWVNNHAHIVKTYCNIPLEYLSFFFTGVDLFPFITGSAQPKLTKSNLSNIEISLPPLTEQHRIVSAIESLFARLDAANQRLDRVPDIIKKFRQSLLAAACGGRLTEDWRDKDESIENADKIIEIIKKEKNAIQKKNQKDKDYFVIPYEVPNNWSWTNIECISKSMKNGIYKKQEFYSDNGIACLRMYNIEDGLIVWKNIKRMNLSDDEIADYLLEPGDILVNRVNSRELVGKAAPIPDDIEPCIYESKNIRLKIFNQWILSKYVGYWFQVYAQQYFNLNAQQTVNMASINQQQLGSMAFPLPPLPEQHEIVQRVDALFALADSIEAKVAAARDRTEKLRQSILAKAFSGELVETEAELARREGRDYEPADVLLERIKAEQEKSGKKGKAAK